MSATGSGRGAGPALDRQAELLHSRAPRRIAMRSLENEQEEGSGAHGPDHQTQRRGAGVDGHGAVSAPVPAGQYLAAGRASGTRWWGRPSRFLTTLTVGTSGDKTGFQDGLFADVEVDNRLRARGFLGSTRNWDEPQSAYAGGTLNDKDETRGYGNGFPW